MDSECDWLLLIQTAISYNLNPTIPRTVTVPVESMNATVAKSESRISEETEKLEDLLPKVIDETLQYVFKEDGGKIIRNFIGNRCHLKRKEIAEKPEVFSAGLEKILGSGARVIEKLILKNLHRKLGLKFEEKRGYEFPDYIKELKKR